MLRAEEQFYVIEDPTTVARRLDLYFTLLTQIEERGLGSARAMKLRTQCEQMFSALLPIVLQNSLGLDCRA
jgi:hypothetical protein